MGGRVKYIKFKIKCINKEKNINELEDTVQNREKTLLNEISSYKLKLQKLENDHDKLKKVSID